MIYLLIPLAVIVLGIALTLAGVLPIIVTGGANDGANAYQNIFFIRLFNDIPQNAAELAQELFEWRWRWCRPWTWFCDAGKREMELTSHECENQARVLIYGGGVNGEGEGELRHAEAQTMGTYDWLKNLTPDQCEAEMLARRPKALAWVQANRSKLERYR